MDAAVAFVAIVTVMAHFDHRDSRGRRSSCSPGSSCGIGDRHELCGSSDVCGLPTLVAVVTLVAIVMFVDVVVLHGYCHCYSRDSPNSQCKISLCGWSNMNGLMQCASCGSFVLLVVHCTAPGGINTVTLLHPYGCFAAPIQLLYSLFCAHRVALLVARWILLSGIGKVAFLYAYGCCIGAIAWQCSCSAGAIALLVHSLWCRSPALAPVPLDVSQWRPSISSCFLIDSQYVVAMHALPCVLLAFKHCVAD